MKNLILLLFICLGFSLTAQSKLKVVCSASMLSDMTQNIAGDKIDLELLVPVGSDPHLYEPTPSDVVKVANADLIFINGLTFEGWILELIENSGTRASVDTVTVGVDAIESTTYKDAFDPHAWMDAENGIIYCKNILNALVELDPKNTSFYKKNYEDYVAALRDLDQYILDKITTVPEKKRVLITSHDAFEYYGKKYGLRLEAIQGISTDAEARVSDIQRINKVIKETNVPAIFIESTINPTMMQQIAEDNGIKIGGELFADSIGGKKSGANSYIDMLKHNTDTIVNALNGLEFQEAEESKTGWLNIVLGILFTALLLGAIVKLNQ